MKTTILISAALLLALLADCARAELSEIEWNAEGQAQREFQVPPSKFAEWCGKLQRGDKVQWQFESSAPLNYNIHYHEGKDVHFPVKQDGVAQAEGTLEVALDQDYCWMWTSQADQADAPVALKATLVRSRKAF